MRTRLVPRRLGAVVLATAAILALAGCSILSSPYSNEQRDGGIEPEATIAQLTSLSGVADARFSTIPWSSPGEGGLGASDGMDVVLEVGFETDVHLADPEAALDSLLALAWATNADFPKGAVAVVFTGGVSPNFDWVELIEARWGERASADFSMVANLEAADISLADKSFAAVYDSRVEERFGEWPGEPPADFTLDIGDGAPSPVLVPALEDASMYIGAVQPVDCWRVNIGRSTDATGEYSGEVEIELLLDGESLGTAMLIGSAETSDDAFCGYGDEPFDATRYTVVATPTTEGDDRFALTPVTAAGVEPKS